MKSAPLKMWDVCISLAVFFPRSTHHTMSSEKLKEGYTRIISVPLSLFEILLFYTVLWGILVLTFVLMLVPQWVHLLHSTHCLALNPHADACTYIHATASKCHQKELIHCATSWRGRPSFAMGCSGKCLSAYPWSYLRHMYHGTKRHGLKKGLGRSGWWLDLMILKDFPI